MNENPAQDDREMVPAAGFEPAPREGHEPESCASANSATRAIYQRASENAHNPTPPQARIVIWQHIQSKAA